MIGAVETLRHDVQLRCLDKVAARMVAILEMVAVGTVAAF